MYDNIGNNMEAVKKDKQQTLTITLGDYWNMLMQA